MARVNNIRRTITTCACLGQHVNEFGEFEDFCDTIGQDVDYDKANRILRQRWNDDSITINKIEKETNQYSMTVEEFIAYAHETPITEKEN